MSDPLFAAIRKVEAADLRARVAELEEANDKLHDELGDKMNAHLISTSRIAELERRLELLQEEYE